MKNLVEEHFLIQIEFSYSNTKVKILPFMCLQARKWMKTVTASSQKVHVKFELLLSVVIFIRLRCHYYDVKNSALLHLSKNPDHITIIE